jgi:hypothetical protein
MLPMVVAFYGWSAQARLPVYCVLFAVTALGFCVIISMISMIAYVVDAFGLYSASALTAVLITRCLMGTFLPLATPGLHAAVGYGWGFTILAGACLLLAPIPALVMRYGAKWRRQCEYTKLD